jgi:ABC-type antimicrobial peptide transport system permease subunit
LLRRKVSILVVLILVNFLLIFSLGAYFSVNKIINTYTEQYYNETGISSVEADLVYRPVYNAYKIYEESFGHTTGSFSPLQSNMNFRLLSAIREIPAVSTPPFDFPTETSKEDMFSFNDIEKAKELPYVRGIWIPLETNFINISQGNFNSNVVKFYVLPGYLEAWGLNIKQGRDFNRSDGTDKCIIGSSLAGSIFPGDNPVGKKLGAPFNCEIIGVLDKYEPQSIVHGNVVLPDIDPNLSVYLPETEMLTDFANGINNVSLFIAVSEPGKGETVSQEIKSLFSYKDNSKMKLSVYPAVQNIAHNVGLDVRVMTLQFLLKYILLLLIGAILAAGFAIFVEIHTRTREISIRRALGTSKKKIVLPFLSEGILLAVIAWLISLLVFIISRTQLENIFSIMTSGRIFSIFNTFLLQNPFIPFPQSIETIEFSLNANFIFMSLGMVVVTSIVFSIYPALRASSIRPSFGIKYRGGVSSRSTSFMRDSVGIVALAITLVITFLCINESGRIISDNINVSRVIGGGVLRVEEYMSDKLLNYEELSDIESALQDNGYETGVLNGRLIIWMNTKDIANGWVRIISGDAALNEIYNLHVKEGSFYDESAVKSLSPEVIVGEEALKLMGYDTKSFNDIGVIYIQSLGYVKITGLLDKTESDLINRTIYTPLTTQYGDNTKNLLIKDVKPENLDEVKNIIKGIAGNDYDNLIIEYGGPFVDALTQANNTTYGFLSLISLILLLEGFVSLSNFLYLYSLLKKKDNAILRALGASKRYIFKKNLRHHFILSIFAISIAFLTSSVFLIGKESSLFTIYTLPWIILIIIISFVVSIIFSISEARRIEEVLPSRELRNL